MDDLMIPAMTSETLARENEQPDEQNQMAQQDAIGQLKKIRSSLGALQDAVILLDHNDGVEWWNQAAQTLLLLQAEDKGCYTSSFKHEGYR